MPGTLVSDANAPVLWDATVTAITATDTSVIDDVVVGNPGWVRVLVDFDDCDFASSDEVVTIAISGSDDGTTYYTLHQFPVTAADVSDTQMWADMYVDYYYMQASLTIAGTTPSFKGKITVNEPHFKRAAGQSAVPA